MKFLTFDTETTGLPTNWAAPIGSPAWPRLVELALQIIDEHGKIYFEASTIIRPNGFEIPKNVVEIHGITTDIALAEGKDLESTILAFVKRLDDIDYIVAHNFDFDKKIFLGECLRMGMFGAYNTFCSKGNICTKRTSTNVCKIPNKNRKGYKWPTLSELHTHYFGTPVEGAHRALNDVRATSNCLLKLIEENHIEL